MKSLNISVSFGAGLLSVRAFVMAAMAAVFAFGMACQANSLGPADDVDSQTVRGTIERVEPLSLTELSALAIRDDSGKVWTFEAQGKRFIRFTPSHLTEHQFLGLKVNVMFHEEGGVLVIDDITD